MTTKHKYVPLKGDVGTWCGYTGDAFISCGLSRSNEIHDTTNQAARCVDCGHDDGTDRGGQCVHPLEGVDSLSVAVWDDNHCGHKCVNFALATESQDEGAAVKSPFPPCRHCEQVHWPPCVPPSLQGEPQAQTGDEEMDVNEATVCEHGKKPSEYCFDCVRKRHSEDMADGMFDYEDQERSNASSETLRAAQGDGVAGLPLCPVHAAIDARGSLEVAISGNNCVACSLNERQELLDLLAPFAPEDASEDSVTVLRKLAEFYDTHVGESRVVVSYPTPSPLPEGLMYEDQLPADMPQADYDTWYKESFVDGVRVGPKYPSPSSLPEGREQLPLSALLAIDISSADAIAYQLEQGKDNGDLSREVLAVTLRRFANTFRLANTRATAPVVETLFEAKLLGFDDKWRITLCQPCLMRAIDEQFVISSSAIPTAPVEEKQNEQS